MRAASRSAADGANVFFEHAVTTLVSQGSDLPQDARSRKIFLHYQFLDDGLVEIQLGGTRLALRGAFLHPAYGFDVDVQLPRNRLVALPLGQQAEDLLVALGALPHFQLSRTLAEASASTRRDSHDLVDSRSPARIRRSSSAGAGRNICRVRGVTPWRIRR